MSLRETIIADMHRDLSGLGDCVSITPTSLALKRQRAYAADRLEPRIEYTSLEHLKQMARGVLSGRYDSESDETEAQQGEMFSGRLQTRYPLPRKQGEEPVYKLRDALTDQEAAWNVAVLRKSAEARLLHADALEAWAQSRQAAA